MKITENISKPDSRKAICEKKVLQSGMEEKIKEFVEDSTEDCTTA
jgi:hypothetical protein